MKTFLFLAGTIMLLFLGAVFLLMQPIIFEDAPFAAPPVDAVALEGHVRKLSVDFFPRSFDQPDNIEKAARYIEAHFLESGGRVESQSFQAEERSYRNIIASYGPLGGPVIVVGAHYDSYGDVTDPQPKYTPGADDNASGVAGLLALADLLRDNPPAKRVQLVAYCLEEPPFFGTDYMGSFAHATELAAANVEVLGMLSLEMIGFFSDEEASQNFPVSLMHLLYPSRGNFIGVIGRFQDISLTRQVKAAMKSASDLPVYSMNAPAMFPGVALSDQRNFWRLNYPAVMISNTAFYRNFNYHTPGDTFDKLDYVRMSKVIQAVFTAINSL